MSEIFYNPYNSRMRPKTQLKFAFNNIDLIDAKQEINDITGKKSYMIFVKINKKMSDIITRIAKCATINFKKCSDLCDLVVPELKDGDILKLHIPVRYNRLEVKATSASCPMFTPHDLFDLKFPVTIDELHIKLRTVYYFIDQPGSEKCGMSWECKEIILL